MKLHLLHKNQTSNLNYSYFEGDEFLKLWHYHKELELVYIVSGKGTLYVGDFISNYKKENIFLIGSNVPHMFESEPKNIEPSISRVIHLNPNFLNNITLVSDEFKYIKTIVEQSARGLKFQKKNSEAIKKLFFKISNSSAQVQILQTLKILYHFSKNKNIKKFGSSNWLGKAKINDNRMTIIIEHIMMNFKNEVRLEQVADLVAMNKTAFCRYFKQNTNTTFTSYLNNVRINYAKKLLKENNGSNTVTLACYNSGFNSLSYFNRIFKKLTGLTPSDYQ